MPIKLAIATFGLRDPGLLRLAKQIGTVIGIIVIVMRTVIEIDLDQGKMKEDNQVTRQAETLDTGLGVKGIVQTMVVIGTVLVDMTTTNSIRMEDRETDNTRYQQAFGMLGAGTLMTI